MGSPAKVLGPADVRRLKTHAGRGRQSQRNVVIVLLSFNAGLRACEIAGLEWSMVLDPEGKVAQWLWIDRSIAKLGHPRRIPVHADLRAALVRLHKGVGRPRAGPVVQSLHGGHMRPRAIVNWFKARYDELGLDGCSSHSGRRTFITRSARLIARAGGSLRDVQELAGHRAITTTERYIEGDRDAQRKLVRML